MEDTRDTAERVQSKREVKWRVRFEREADTYHYFHSLIIKPLSICVHHSYLLIFKLQPAYIIQFSEAEYCVGDFPNAFLNIEYVVFAPKIRFTALLGLAIDVQLLSSHMIDHFALLRAMRRPVSCSNRLGCWTCWPV